MLLYHQVMKDTLLSFKTILVTITTKSKHNNHDDYHATIYICVVII